MSVVKIKLKMLTYNELIKLRENLLKDSISIEFARKQYWDNHEEDKKSWHTKDWKERRSKVIKDKCEICDSNDTLTLQHRSHPRKYGHYEREVERSCTKVYMESKPVVREEELREYISQNYNYTPAPTCPKCDGRYPNKRARKIPHFRCKKCHHEFNEPDYKSENDLIAKFYDDEEAIEVRDKCFVSNVDRTVRHNLSDIRYWFQREMMRNKYSDRIEKVAFLLLLEDQIKYLSFEDTITACNKCAFNYDINKLELCPKCKKHYKGLQYSTCVSCLPEEKRKEAQKSIEFGKEMRDMEKRLGID